MKVLKITILALCLPMLTFAQKSEAGVTLGLSHYLGDLVDANFTLKDQSLVYGAFYKYHVNNNLAVRGYLNLGKVQGDDDSFDNEARGYSFESSIFDIGVTAEYAFLTKDRYDGAGTFQPSFSPYIFVGLGFFSFDPEVEGLPANSPDLTDDYDTAGITIPIGVGIKYDLSERWTLGGEVSWRPTFTDYLDGISQSGNPDKDDWYFVGALTLGYRFGDADVFNTNN